MGFLATLILSIALLEVLLLTILVSVIWPADEIEKYSSQSQTQDFLNAHLHVKAKDGEYMDTIQGDVPNFRVICTYPEEGTKTKRKGGNRDWNGNQNYLNCSRIVGSEMVHFSLDSGHFIKLLSAIRSYQNVLRVSIDVVKGVPVPVAEKIENGNSTTGDGNGNGPATPIKNVMYTTTSTPLASTSTSMSTPPQIPSPETIPKPTLETLSIQNGRIKNNSYTPRKPAESTTTLKLKITGRWGFFFSERF